MLVWSVLAKITMSIQLASADLCSLCSGLHVPIKYMFLFWLQMIAHIQKEKDALNIEKQNVEKKFEASTKEAKGRKDL